MTKSEFIAELAKLTPNSTFLYLHHYRSASNELSNFNIIYHINYLSALKRSVLILESLVPNSAIQSTAKQELLSSFNSSINKIITQPIENLDDGYQRFYSNNSYIKGVKLHIESNQLHIYGFVHQKVVLEPGNYPKVNSSSLTIEKNKLRQLCPVSKFRNFIISPDNVEKITVQKITLLPPID